MNGGLIEQINAPRVFNLEDITIGMKLGQGSYGTVYQGIIQVDKTECAIKKIDTKNHKKVHEYTMKEIHALQRLNGMPGIIQILGYIQENSFIYIVMNLCQTDLYHFCTKYSPYLDQIFRLKLASLILDGVSQIHQAGLIHRDLKPENILLKYDQKVFDSEQKIRASLEDLEQQIEVQICDFGVCGKPLGKTKLGTPQYLAPEVDSRTQQTYQVDVYSLGVIFYWLFTNQRLNNGQGFNMKYFQKCHSQLGESIRAMVSFNPENRPKIEDVQSLVRSELQGYQNMFETQLVDQEELQEQISTNKPQDTDSGEWEILN